jgi:hypothetical protein
VNITYVYADSKEEWNCAEWRCAVPARAIQQSGRHTARMIDIVSFAYNTPEADEICKSSDVIVIQRNLFEPVMKTVQHWKAMDKIVIADFDDAYNLMPPAVKNYRFWIEGLMDNTENPSGPPIKITPPPLAQFKLGLRVVHGATVPSEQLVNDWSGITDVHLLPNYIELERYINIAPKPHDGIIIGWGGSLSHFHSFKESGVLKALQRVCQARSNVKVLICGDRRVFDLMPIAPEQKMFQPWTAIDYWPQLLSIFDIGIAPLYGQYDQRRSWIKILEYMVMKIPWVASDGPAYQSLRPYGWLVKNTPNGWERILLDLVDHLEDYRDEAFRDPYLFGLSQGVNENVENIISVYTSILDKNTPAEVG